MNALDVAVNHSLADLANKERVDNNFSANLAGNLSTLRLLIEHETTIGHSERD